MNRLLAIALLFLAACAPGKNAAGPDAPAGEGRIASPHSVFFAQVKALCGKAFEGRVVSAEAADQAMAAERLVMHVRTCEDNIVRIPFHVGDNRSRTWVLTRTEEGLRLKHDHRHQDGVEDAVTQYGGDSAAASNERMEFPADQHSIDLFTRENLAVSVANVWAMELRPGETFVYELKRPERHLRVEFDLTREVAPPPPPWGAE